MKVYFCTRDAISYLYHNFMLCCLDLIYNLSIEVAAYHFESHNQTNQLIRYH